MYSALGLIVVLNLLGALFSLISPWIYREVVNFLTTRKLSAVFAYLIHSTDPLHIFFGLAILYGILTMVWVIINQWMWYLQSMAAILSWSHLSNKSLRKLHEFSVSYFEKKSPGWLRERIQTGVREFWGIVQSVVADLLPLAVKLIIASYILFRFSPSLSLAIIIAAPAYILITIWRAKIMRFWEKKIRNQQEKYSKAVMDNIYSYQLIKEFSQEAREQSRVAAIAHTIKNLRSHQQILMFWTAIAREIFYIGAELWVYGYGGYLVLMGNLSIGDLVLFIAYLESVMSPLGRVMKIYDTVQIGLVSAERLFGIWDRQDEIKDLPEAKPIKITKGAIEFDRVSFSYEAGKQSKNRRVIFRKFNLKIEPKEVVALVGPSGAGKSTIVKLLLRFYGPTMGRILIDGQDISKVTQASLRKNVATVMQDVGVFNNTIGYNLKYGKPRASQTAIEQAAKIANLYVFIMSLRNKFKTLIGEKGVRLSGGEKQRLSIARAVLKNAPILVMDEATSALDSENEQKIQEAMWELIKGHTTIIIAHRLSTVKKVDRIVVIDEKGRVIEQGNHEALLLAGGYYSRLFRMQGEFLLR